MAFRMRSDNVAVVQNEAVQIPDFLAQCRRFDFSSYPRYQRTCKIHNAQSRLVLVLQKSSQFKKRNTDEWASTNHHMEGFSRHNSSLIGGKNQAKFENE